MNRRGLPDYGASVTNHYRGMEQSATCEEMQCLDREFSNGLIIMSGKSGEILQVIADVVERLEKADIPYMISGSIAGNIYGEPRFTNDIDIVLQVGDHHRQTIYNCFADGYYLSQVAVEDAFTRLGMLNIIHSTLFVKCDLIFLRPDEFSQNAFKRRQAVQIENHNVFFISLEDLILQKLLWRKETQSEQQLSDIKRLIAQNDAILDREHLRTWSQRLDLQEEMAKFL